MLGEDKEVSMQTVEEFMSCFFQDQAEREACEACEERYRRFQEKYFTTEYLVKSRARSEEFASQQKVNPPFVVSVEDHRASAVVITNEPFASSHRRHRYHLRFSEAGWLIDRQDSECLVCNGTGRMCSGVCKACGGDGWR